MVQVNKATLPSGASVPATKGGNVSVKINIATKPRSQRHGMAFNIRWLIGMYMACCFSMVYFIAPFYIVSSFFILAFYSYTKLWVWVYLSPMIVSAMIPPIAMPFVIRCLSPMLDYFDYDEIHEISPINVAEEIRSGRKNYICIFQPHGVISFVGILSAVHATIPEFVGTLPTAVADVLLYTPILKHVLGIFRLISASKKSLQRTLKKKGVLGTIVLYVGGMAELFLSDAQYEKLYLMNRKGFIKLALQEGVDVVPVYLFGNTIVLSILKTGFLANVSRRVSSFLVFQFTKCAKNIG